MTEIKAFDVDGKEISRGDIVEIVSPKEGFPHAWLKVGKKLRVSYWEDRSLGSKYKYVCVFLKSKKGDKLCSQGMQDKSLRVIKNAN